MSFCLGLTGGIATGKTTVAEIFRRFGFPVVDADHIARELLLPGQEGWHRVRATFGEMYFEANGQLNRKKLGQTVFDDPSQRKRLDAILHPLIWQRLEAEKKRLSQKQTPLIIFDIPLLFETGRSHFCDETLVVFVPEDLQLQRLILRDHLSLAAARQRIVSQMPFAQKRKLADGVIENTGDHANLEKQVADWLRVHDFTKHDPTE